MRGAGWERIPGTENKKVKDLQVSVYRVEEQQRGQCGWTEARNGRAGGNEGGAIEDQDESLGF